MVISRGKPNQFGEKAAPVTLYPPKYVTLRKPHIHSLSAVANQNQLSTQ
jgi:hypothetical protein